VNKKIVWFSQRGFDLLSGDATVVEVLQLVLTRLENSCASCWDRAKGKKLRLAKDQEIPKSLLSLNHNLFQLILDYTLAERDHPFRQVCRATREAWLAHPFSLPWMMAWEVSWMNRSRLSFDQEKELERNMQRLMRSSFSGLKQRQKKAYRAKRCKQILARAMSWFSDHSLSDPLKKQELESLVLRLKMPRMTVTHYRYQGVHAHDEWEVSFSIGPYFLWHLDGYGVERDYYGNPELYIPDKKELTQMR